MKILHVITALEVGGAETVLERLVTADRVNTHAIVSLQEVGALGRRLIDKGFAVDALNLKSGRVPGPRALARLWKLMRDSRPDIVQTWMYHANLLGGAVAKAAGMPCICWNVRRTHFDIETLRQRTKLVARLSGWLSPYVPDRVVYCAQGAVAHHVDRGYDPGRSVVIHNGIDTDVFAVDETAGARLRAEIGIAADTTLVGCIGRAHPDKDHGTLFAALRRAANDYPDLRCVLAGRGAVADNRELVDLASAAGVLDRIIFLGIRNDLPAIMNALDLHVSSSLSEGFPNVIAEAMACGTPCVSTDVGDARVIIGDHGWLVWPRAPAELAEAMVDALRMRGTDRWTALCSAVRQRCETRFGMDRMVGSYRRLWADAAGARSS